MKENEIKCQWNPFQTTFYFLLLCVIVCVCVSVSLCNKSYILQSNSISRPILPIPNLNFQFVQFVFFCFRQEYFFIIIFFFFMSSAQRRSQSHLVCQLMCAGFFCVRSFVETAQTDMNRNVLEAPSVCVCVRKCMRCIWQTPSVRELVNIDDI